VTKLDELLRKMADDIPGFQSASVVGIDGLALAIYSVSKFDTDLGNAQFALIMKLVEKTVNLLSKSNVQDNLVTTKKSFILSRFIGDNNYYVNTVVDRANGSLGNVRLISRQFSKDIWDAVPKRKR
jgi:predicted regulator of Ras-like GTPase activity (Roadblock/LC7/MglB family)